MHKEDLTTKVEVTSGLQQASPEEDMPEILHVCTHTAAELLFLNAGTLYSEFLARETD